YVADPPFTEAHLVARLAFPSLATPTVTVTPNSYPCAIEDVGWSPDGQWLAVIALQGVGGRGEQRLYALDLHAFPLPQDNGNHSTVAVPASALTDLGEAGETFTWPATSHTITMAGYESIFDVDLLTHERHTVLAQQGAQFCTASWTPDGATLVFILCRPGIVEAGGPQAQLYIYMPDATTHP
ncbi:MAG TPA: hypothetical protein VH393_00340, partial [Ktedonobacterales bacterium]